MALPPKPKSRPVVLRTLLAGALSAGALGACSDDAGTPPDAVIAPQPPPQPPPQPAPDAMPTPDAFQPPPPQPPPQPPPPFDAMQPAPDAFPPIPPQPPPQPPPDDPIDPIEGLGSQPGKRGR